MSRELRCALKPYLQKEMRNSKGIIKKDSVRFNKAVFDYIQYLEGVINENVDPDVVRNYECQLLKKTIEKEKNCAKRKRSASVHFRSTSSDRDYSTRSTSPVNKKIRYNLRSKRNYVNLNESSCENEAVGKSNTIPTVAKQTQIETNDDGNSSVIEISDQDQLSDVNSNDLNNSANFESMNEMLDLVNEVIQDHEEHFNSGSDISNLFPSPSHDMATAMSSGAIKIIAYDQSTAENQQNDFNKYDKIYKELFSVCNQRN